MAERTQINGRVYARVVRNYVGHSYNSYGHNGMEVWIMPKKKEKDSVEVEELVIPTELLEKEPTELSADEKGIQTIIEYLKKTRENIRAAEKAGKRITSKSARVKPPEKAGDNILDVLVDNV